MGDEVHLFFLSIIRHQKNSITKKQDFHANLSLPTNSFFLLLFLFCFVYFSGVETGGGLGITWSIYEQMTGNCTA